MNPRSWFIRMGKRGTGLCVWEEAMKRTRKRNFSSFNVHCVYRTMCGWCFHPSRRKYLTRLMHVPAVFFYVSFLTCLYLPYMILSYGEPRGPGQFIASLIDNEYRVAERISPRVTNRQQTQPGERARDAEMHLGHRSPSHTSIESRQEINQHINMSTP